MPWFKVDDALYSHPKWLRTSPSARGLWVTAGSWCAAHLMDGLVPAHVLSILGGSSRLAQELVDAGLWFTDPDGWRFHAWLEFQPSSGQVEADRAAARERQQRARDKARESRRDGSVTRGEVTPVVTVPPTRPDPTSDVTPPTPRKRAAQKRTQPEPPNPSSLIPPVSAVIADLPPFDPEAGKDAVRQIRAARYPNPAAEAATAGVLDTSTNRNAS